MRRNAWVILTVNSMTIGSTVDRIFEMKTFAKTKKGISAQKKAFRSRRNAHALWEVEQEDTQLLCFGITNKKYLRTCQFFTADPCQANRVGYLLALVLLRLVSEKMETNLKTPGSVPRFRRFDVLRE